MVDVGRVRDHRERREARGAPVLDLQLAEATHVDAARAIAHPLLVRRRNRDGLLSLKAPAGDDNRPRAALARPLLGQTQLLPLPLGERDGWR